MRGFLDDSRTTCGEWLDLVNHPARKQGKTTCEDMADHLKYSTNSSECVPVDEDAGVSTSVCSSIKTSQECDARADECRWSNAHDDTREEIRKATFDRNQAAEAVRRSTAQMGPGFLLELGGEIVGADQALNLL